MLIRHGGRERVDLRPISFIPGVARYSHGSCVIQSGFSQIFCTATFFERCSEDPLLKVDCGILPLSGQERVGRYGFLSSATKKSMDEFVAKSLSFCLNPDAMNGYGVMIDCDVIQSDGSSKSLILSGACAALMIAFKNPIFSKKFLQMPLHTSAMGISCGIVNGHVLWDLNADEGELSESYVTFALNYKGKIIALDEEKRRSGEKKDWIVLAQSEISLINRGLQKQFYALMRAA